MRVEFTKVEHKSKVLCRWDAVRRRDLRVPGTVMGTGRGLPHDLTQYVIEAATGYRNGFWELVSRGATFASTGRKRTKPGRALIVEHRAELLESEQHAGRHTVAWMAGETTPVTEALDRALVQWRALEPEERLVFEWPSAVGTVEPRVATTTSTGKAATRSAKR